jgi:imidazolonepropionase
MWDKLWYNASLVDESGTQLTNHAIAVNDSKIAWVGPMEEKLIGNARKTHDCHQRVITPGLIDCHTHLVYAGNRANEFTMRLQGLTYAEIAQAGGGIKSTVKMTRLASEDELLQQALPRLCAMIKQGVTTVEVKSGYGLNACTELKMLRVAKKLENATGMRIKKTFLGAHAIPDEMDADSYIDYLCDDVLPHAYEQELVDAVDIFSESIAFNLAQTEKLLTKAVALGLAIKCHAEQLSDIGASGLAASLGALSCDHLEYISDESLQKMAMHDTVAVLLPGAYYFLKETTPPPITKMRKYGIKMALATDCNPGSSPTTSLSLMMNMACTLFGLTVTEAYQAVTLNAAKALGLSKDIGQLKAGFHADFILWPFTDIAELCYGFGVDYDKQLIVGGTLFSLDSIDSGIK